MYCSMCLSTSLPSLSEQQLVDCSGSAGNLGCNGGEQDWAFAWIISNGGICSEASYPYTAVDGTCQKTCTPVAHITNYTDVPNGNQTALEAAIAQQPVAVSVDANGGAWQFYTSGVLTSHCGKQLDHAVLATGYGTDSSGQDYYTIKNSWGTDWGVNGYILLGRGAAFNPDGQCGVQTGSSWPSM